MKKLTFAKPKKFNKTKAKNKLDKLFSLKVRSLGYCMFRGSDDITCGGVLQAAHVIGRGNLFLRWNPKNAICICAGHHVWYTFHPEAWREMMETFHEPYDWLLAHRNEKIKFNEIYFTEKLKEMI